MEALEKRPLTTAEEAPSLVATRYRRGMDARWLPGLFRELTPQEQNLVARALGDLPHDHCRSLLDTLWRQINAGDLDMFTLKDAGGRIYAVSFYQVETLLDGSRDFFSVVTVAIAQCGRRLAETDIEAMDKAARELSCNSMSMRTLRHGLAKTLCDRHGWFCSEVILRKVL